MITVKSFLLSLPSFLLSILLSKYYWKTITKNKTCHI